MARKSTSVRRRKKQKRIHVDLNRCKGCRLCYELCPLTVAGNPVLDMSKDFSERGVHYPVIVNLEVCTVCRICEGICPDFAIFVEEIEE